MNQQNCEEQLDYAWIVLSFIDMILFTLGVADTIPYDYLFAHILLILCAIIIFIILIIMLNFFIMYNNLELHKEIAS